MRSPFVIPVYPALDSFPRLRKVYELMLPYAFFLEASEEAFDDSVLFRGVRRDKLLAEAIETAGLAETFALKYEPVVAPYDRSFCGLQSQRSKSSQTGRL